MNKSWQKQPGRPQWLDQLNLVIISLALAGLIGWQTLRYGLFRFILAWNQLPLASIDLGGTLVALGLIGLISWQLLVFSRAPQKIKVQLEPDLITQETVLAPPAEIKIASGEGTIKLTREQLDTSLREATTAGEQQIISQNEAINCALAAYYLGDMATFNQYLARAKAMDPNCDRF